MTGGWRGIEPLEVLLCVGLGLPPRSGGTSPSKDKGSGLVDDAFEEFDPDDFPGLEEAVKILFPSLRDVSPLQGGPPPRRADGAEQEYEIEMLERLSRVCALHHAVIAD